MRLFRQGVVRRVVAVAALLVLVVAAGCGSGRYPVTGRVLFEDGTPLEEGTVVGESGEGADKVMAQGSLQRDGTFKWGTDKPGDGARPGKYRVVVFPVALGDADLAKGMLPAVDQKYTKFETSEIEFEVI